VCGLGLGFGSVRPQVGSDRWAPPIGGCDGGRRRWTGVGPKLGCHLCWKTMLGQKRGRKREREKVKASHFRNEIKQMNSNLKLNSNNRK
jgi:hypothetical protein